MFDHLIGVIQSFSAGPVIATIAMVLEFGLRLIPSAKPMSILLVVQEFLHGLGNLFGAISAAADKIIPQKLS